MKKIITFVGAILALVLLTNSLLAANGDFKLGNEVLFSKYSTYGKYLEGKKVGLLTNQTGVNSSGQSTIDVFWNDGRINLVALFGPEHGIDGLSTAGAVVQSGIYEKYNIPVYSLYGSTRTPTKAMLDKIDVLVVDIQDIGARSYTYISTVQYCMKAAKQYGKKVIVLDRPNPVGCSIVEGDVMDPKYITFVGCDILPMSHGMTMGELAKYFNRSIYADLTVVPMEDYTRDMVWQDTGLNWVATSPNIPDLQSVFGYMATGMGEGTGVGQQSQFKWVGADGLNSTNYAKSLNALGLPGINFIAETRGTRGGVKLDITDYHKFNPALTGYAVLSVAKQQNNFTVPKTVTTMVMFEKIMGGTEMGQWLDKKYSVNQMKAAYQSELSSFKKVRESYLIYTTNTTQTRDWGAYTPVVQLSKSKVNFNITVLVNGNFLKPQDGMGAYVNSDGRTMVAMRLITDALGAEMKYNSSNRTIQISKGSDTIEMMLDSKIIYTSSGSIAMDTSPSIIDGTTFLPLKYVGEALNSEVKWYGLNKLVTVSDK